MIQQITTGAMMVSIRPRSIGVLLCAALAFPAAAVADEPDWKLGAGFSRSGVTFLMVPGSGFGGLGGVPMEVGEEAVGTVERRLSDGQWLMFRGTARSSLLDADTDDRQLSYGVSIGYRVEMRRTERLCVSWYLAASGSGVRASTHKSYIVGGAFGVAVDLTLLDALELRLSTSIVSVDHRWVTSNIGLTPDNSTTKTLGAQLGFAPGLSLMISL